MLMQSFFSRHAFMVALLATVAVTAAVTSHAQEISAQAQAVFGPLIASSCSSSSPCLQWTNKGTGPGVAGVSSKGKGISGTSTSGSGVSGTSSSGVGVRGAATTGVGVFGVSSGTVEAVGGVSSGSGPALFGFSANGMGVQGESDNNIGVFAESSTKDGVFATSGINDGINASTTNNSTTAKRGRSGIYAHDDSTDGGHLNLGVGGFSTNGIGIEAGSTNWIGLNVIGGLYNSSADVPALSVIGNANSSGFPVPPDLIDACSPATVNPCDEPHAAFRVLHYGGVVSADLLTDNVFVTSCLEVSAGSCGPGDVNITGQYQKSGTCVAGCTAATTSHAGRAVVSYVATQSLPSTDDFGEATLQNGSAYVQIDAAFANVIDRSANYLVFITPEGPSRGLYVTQKTRAGFEVMENPGGHSTLTFSYRIVAKPLGSRETRLPMMTVPKVRTRGILEPRSSLPR